MGWLVNQVHDDDDQADQIVQAIAATGVVIERVAGSKHFEIPFSSPPRGYALPVNDGKGFQEFQRQDTRNPILLPCAAKRAEELDFVVGMRFRCFSYIEMTWQFP